MPTFTGTSGNDILVGSVDADTLTGLAGNDTLTGGLGPDALGGGADNDTYIWNLGDGNDSVSETGGIDSLRLAGLPGSAFFIGIGSSNLTVTHVASGATVTLLSQTSNFNNVVEQLEFSNFTYDMTFGFGYAGSASGETLYGGLFRDVIAGLAGNDFIYGRDGDDNLFGGTENDSLNGEAGADILYGEAGIDTLNGGDGDDRLIGGVGNDSLNGGNGVNDWAWYLGETSGITANLTTNSATGATIGTDTMNGVENIFGSEASDTLTGSTAANTINGGAGVDNISGVDGNDRLFGGANSDTVNGGAGADVIYGDEPFSPSQTSTVGGVTQAGNPLALSLTGARWDPDGATTVSGLIGAQGGVAGLNIVFVIDRSGSMSATFLGDETVPDLNGDGSANTLMDGAISGFTALTQSIINAGLGAFANITVAAFDDSAFIAYSGQASRDNNANGISDVVDALRTLTPGGSTYYDLGLQQAISALQSTPNGSNFVFFMSDGEPNGGPYGDEVSALLTSYNADIRAIGLGDGASLPALDLVDDGLSNNSAERVQLPSQLSAALTAGAIDPSTIDRVEIYVNGTLARTIASSELISTPFGLQYNADLTGLSVTTADVVTARVYTVGPNPVSLTTSITIAQVDAAVGGHDTLIGGDGDDIIDGNAGDDNISGNSGSDILIGGPGADGLNGGTGIDTADYSAEVQSVIVNLLAGTAVGGGSGSDVLTSIENAVGGAGADTLIAHNGIALISAPDIIKPTSLGNNAVGSAVSLANAFDIQFNANIANSETIPHATVVAAGSNGPEYYSFTAAAGVTIAIDIDATVGIDTEIFLFDSVGTQVFYDDQGGGDPGSTTGNDSGFTYLTATAGVYYIRVEAYSTSTVVPTGAQYTLHVSVPGAALTSSTTLIGSSLFGGLGNDLLQGGAGGDLFDGGLGSDTASYATAAAGVYAFFGDLANATGAAVGDRFFSIENMGGSAFNDLLGMDDFANTINGGAGADRLFGQGGNDTLIGGAGADELQGGAGFDSASYSTSATGVYSFIGDYGAATGDAAGDVFISIEGVIGSAFNDVIGVGNDDNVIDGLAGADQLYGLGGNDVLIGGAGGDGLIGGSGSDWVSYSTAAAGVYAFVGDYGAATGDAAGDVIAEVENMIGTNFADILGMGNDANTIDGLAGNDRLYGQGGNDTLIGGAGNDDLVGGSGADVIIGGDGRDTASYITAAAGVYAFVGDFGAATGDAAGDTLFSIEDMRGSNLGDILGMGADNNVIDGAGGNDQIYGQDGDDTLIGGTGADALIGGNGSDTASYATGGAGVYIFQGDLGNSTGDAAGDTFFSIENLTGSNSGDVLGWNDNANILNGGASNDILYGLGGNDTIIGGTGGDYIDGGLGAADTASYAGAASGVYVFFGDLGAATGEAAGDTLLGIESLTGTDFNDVLGWDNGGNVLTGGLGNDTLYGNGGADVLNGGDGSDTASYATAASGVYIFFGDLGGSTGDAVGDSFVSIESITGSAFADVIGMDGGANTLAGGGGDDRLYGMGGDDALIGGAGADRYAFTASGFGQDTITSFEDGVDHVDFTGYLQIGFGNLVISAATGGVLVTVGSDTIFLGGVTTGQITAADFIFGP